VFYGTQEFQCKARLLASGVLRRLFVTMWLPIGNFSDSLAYRWRSSFDFSPVTPGFGQSALNPARFRHDFVDLQVSRGYYRDLFETRSSYFVVHYSFTYFA